MRHIIFIVIFFIGCSSTETSWAIFNKDNSKLPSNFISDIKIDIHNNVWVATPNAGLAKYDGNDWIVFDSSNSNLQSNNIHSIEIDTNSNIWLGSRQLYLLSENHISIHNINKTRRTPSSSIFKLDSLFPNEINKPQIIYPGIISDIELDNLGNVWLGTMEIGWGWQGYLLKLKGTDCTTYQNFTNNGGVKTIAIDKNRNKWLGGSNKGLCKYNDSLFTFYTTSNSQICDEKIISITIDNEDCLWLGSLKSGISKYDRNSWTNYDTLNSLLPSNFIRTIEISPSNSKWIGTRNGGLSIFDDTDWINFDTTNSEIPSNDITSIAFSSNGSTWVGTNGGGIVVIKKFNGRP